MHIETMLFAGFYYMQTFIWKIYTNYINYLKNSYYCILNINFIN